MRNLVLTLQSGYICRSHKGQSSQYQPVINSHTLGETPGREPETHKQTHDSKDYRHRDEKHTTLRLVRYIAKLSLDFGRAQGVGHGAVGEYACRCAVRKRFAAALACRIHETTSCGRNGL